MDKFNPEAEALLREIVAWVSAAKSSSGQLGQMVLNHGGFVPLLQKRGSLNPETAALIRAFMEAFPDKEALPADLAAKIKEQARAGTPWRPERHRSMLIRFGYFDHVSLNNHSFRRRWLMPITETASNPAAAPAESEMGGGKPRISAAVIRAAKLDGRDLPTFVTGLIEMGLECWRDDRVLHGEPLS
ncbi:hypothetical protein CA223_06735 [Sphingomonas koreensis]|uniref:Uncharacterized protein n=2 Tax=Sphingomonas koreensis TaxID=93064 RepID=A0A1L6J7X0_9SPHN|nr:hypothetical protein BRX40_05745 [Sphingomonas koreensis]RSU22809.1 hypothetical protein CA224_05365 [Sphingomonas koreensis]RSU30717.1 hypothetical protein CA222_01180 [Sphingomonas koreensis]RSU31812.1 hypothetical protein CA225_00260 [Sphingomonas koreensis]RSU39267.1 hypothetical protein BRX39_01270 [Sphingomonas koreensis]